MTIIPGLTTTVRDRIPQFVADLRASDVRTIALFPTAIEPAERTRLYQELESIPNLLIPHVHARTDFTEAEMDYLVERFKTEVFNIHPRANRHAFGPVPAQYSARLFVENVEEAPEDEELAELGGICPDFSHLETARLHGKDEYVERVLRQLAAFRIGCCHVSAIRVGDPNPWNGGWDHHSYVDLSNLDYLARYSRYLPDRWVSLELENSLDEQLAAIPYVERVLGVVCDEVAE
jgi:hypothetical protein